MSDFSEIQLVCDRLADGPTKRQTDGPTDGHAAHWSLEKFTIKHSHLRKCASAQKHSRIPREKNGKITAAWI